MSWFLSLWMCADHSFLPAQRGVVGAVLAPEVGVVIESVLLPWMRLEQECLVGERERA